MNCWSTWRGWSYWPKAVASPWHRATTRWLREVSVRIFNWWCTRNQRTWTRPMNNSLQWSFACIDKRVHGGIHCDKLQLSWWCVSYALFCFCLLVCCFVFYFILVGNVQGQMLLSGIHKELKKKRKDGFYSFLNYYLFSNYFGKQCLKYKKKDMQASIHPCSISSSPFTLKWWLLKMLTNVRL